LLLSSSSSSFFFLFFFVFFLELPNGRVLLIFLHDDKVWSNFSLDVFFLLLFYDFAWLTFVLPNWN
jgi:hypothetical protein